MQRMQHRYGLRLECVDLLGRRTNVRQVGSARAQRIQQMEREFYADPRHSVRGQTVLLIDDVMTTGASLSAAARVLRSNGAKRVYALVYAQKI